MLLLLMLCIIMVVLIEMSNMFIHRFHVHEIVNDNLKVHEHEVLFFPFWFLIHRQRCLSNIMLYWFIYFHCFASHRIVFTYIYPLYIRILHAHFKWTAIERNKSLKSTNIFFKAKGAFNVFIGFSCMLISNIFIRLIIINTSIFSTDCRLIISVNACWPFGYWSLHIKSNDIHRKIISMNLYSRIYNIQCWLLTCSHLTISIYAVCG